LIGTLRQRPRAVGGGAYGVPCRAWQGV